MSLSARRAHGERGRYSREGRDQGQHWRMLAEVTMPENGQEGGEYICSQLGSQGRLEEDLQ